VERYSPLSDTWSAVAPLPDARFDHIAVAVGSAMYVLGGNIDRDHTASVLKFDSTQGTWSQVAPMPEARIGSAACVVGSNIYVFGGGWSQKCDYCSVFKYDTVANEWYTLAPMPHPCPELFANYLDGFIYIVGVGRMWGDRDGRKFLRFDPASSA
jgi:N-acetylneuraminic acid mutarotase